MRNQHYRKEPKKRPDLMQALLLEKKKGKNSVNRNLSKQDLELVRKKFQVDAEKLIINTKPIYMLSNRNNLLKSIHYNYRKGKKFLVVPYKKEFIELLDDRSISYEVKYKVTLN